MAKVLCESCGTSFLYDVVKDMKACPVCGKALWESNEEADNVNVVEDEEEHPDWITWWYYKDPKYGDFSLWDKPPLYPEKLELIKEFKAPPESECGLDEVKRILRTYVPDAFVYKQEAEKIVTCPRCLSKEIQLVPRKFSLLTGFATNKYDRICVRCKKRF